MEGTEQRMFGKDDTVIFISKDADGNECHKYLHQKKNKEFLSTTTLINRIVPEFPRYLISLKMAEAAFPGASEEIIKLEQQKILKEWEDIGDESREWGTGIHKELEQYDITGQIAPDLEPIARKIRAYYKNHYKHFNELLLYHEGFEVAGTSDKVVLRSNRGNPVVDLGDYKTNNRKGIQFDSSSFKKEIFKWNNKYLKEPFQNIEHCNYWEYCLQLSLYGYYIEFTYGYKIGKLDLFFIDRAKGTVNRIAAPYMRLEAIELLNWHRNNPIKEKTYSNERHNMIDESASKIIKTEKITPTDWGDDDF